MKHLAFLDLISDDLERVEDLLRERPEGQHEAVGAAIDHLVGGGGKRLRPALVLLSAHLCNAEVEHAVLAAAAVEMLHTATLVHDDLIDGSLMRRGVETLNAHWSPGATVLTGDYVFARAAYLVSQTGNVRLMRRFAETLMVICNGEVRQMFDGGRTAWASVPASLDGGGSLLTCRVPTFQEYEQRIYAKTASLIALSAEAGAILANADGKVVEALRLYGERLGLAFQIVDDVLDFVADEGTLGKPVGSDLRQGLLTLPVLLFLKEEADHPALRRVLTQDRSDQAVQEAVWAVAGSPAIDQALEVARERADQAKVALGWLPDTPHQEALLALADFVVRRRF